MSKLGKMLIAAAHEGVAIARGEADPETYRVSFKERAERLERAQGAPLVLSSSSADVRLLPPVRLSDLRTISAIQSLARRGVDLALAKASIEALVGSTERPANPVGVYIPRFDGQKEFAAEMSANGVPVVLVRHAASPPTE